MGVKERGGKRRYRKEKGRKWQGEGRYVGRKKERRAR